MKVKDLTAIKIPALKPRDPNQAVLASKKNAGGPMKDKKTALKRGDFKHKGRAYEDMDLVEASLGSRVPYDKFEAWFADLPNGASTVIDEATAVTTASSKSKDFEGVCGKFDAKKKSGWIYEHYLKKSNMTEGQLDEKKPAGAPKWHDSDAPDANGKFKELGVDDLADWLIKTRGKDMQKINGSLQQQIIFNRKKNPTYAKKMESVRAAVKRKLKKD